MTKHRWDSFYRLHQQWKLEYQKYTWIQNLIFLMSVQSVNYLVDTFGLNSYSVNHVCSVFENHGVSLSEKEEIASLQKFINKIISLADQNGGEATSACISILKAIILNSDVRELENCIVRILDFSKSVVFNCSNWNSKHQGWSVVIM